MGICEEARWTHPFPTDDAYHVADSLAQQHYMGKSRPRAAARLARDAAEVFYRRFCNLTEKQDTLHRMAATLRAEGWTLIATGGYLWRHEATGLMVNNNGGVFVSFEQATLRTFESATRAYYLQ